MSWVVVHHVTHPAFVERVPYTIVLVELAEADGMMMYGNLPPEDGPLYDGMPVRAVFERQPDGSTFVQWTAVAGSSRGSSAR